MKNSELEQKFYKVFEIIPATVQEYGSTYFWDTIEKIKEYVLKDCIEQAQYIKSKIQELFKEESEDER